MQNPASVRGNNGPVLLLESSSSSCHFVQDMQLIKPAEIGEEFAVLLLYFVLKITCESLCCVETADVVGWLAISVSTHVLCHVSLSCECPRLKQVA